MPLYKMAGLIMDIDFKYEYGRKRCAEYEYNGSETPDFGVSVSDAEIKEMMQKDGCDFPPAYYESLCVYKNICCQALAYECMFMHCSALSYVGNGVLFTAPSGTGKSTHSALWRRCFGSKVQMVNDDKPLLRRKNGVFYVCGTPWDGKHHLSTNIEVPVKAIVILKRDTHNHIEKASGKSAVYTVLNQTVRPSRPELMFRVMELTDKLLSGVPVYEMGCNISDDAVFTAFRTLKENFE